MKLAIDIDGRRAIPVRALPWVTRWHFGALEVAEALSGDYYKAGGIPFTVAYWLNEDGERLSVPKEFWVGVTQRLEQAEDAEAPDRDWHAIATRLLPEGVWVWADEWTTAYNACPDGPGSLELIVETTEDLQDIQSRLLQQEPYVPPELLPMLLAGFNELAAPAEPEAEPVQQVVPVTDLAEAPQARKSVPLPSTTERELIPATRVVPVVQPEAATKKIRAKKRTWLDVSGAYIAEVIQAGQYRTGKDLYRALETKAGSGSPFDRGTGAHRDSLFVREIAQSLSMKTVQNNFAKLRAMAHEVTP